MEIEFNASSDIVVFAVVTEEDDSFDHAFGTEKAVGIKCDIKKIIAYIEPFSAIDITDKIKDLQINYFKEAIIEEYLKTHYS